MATKLVPANTNKSLRITVPPEVIKALDLREGCQIVWEMVPNDKQFGGDSANVQIGVELDCQRSRQVATNTLPTHYRR